MNEFQNGFQNFKMNFRLSRARDLDLDLGSSDTAYRHTSLIDLHPTYIPNVIKIGRKIFFSRIITIVIVTANFKVT